MTRGPDLYNLYMANRRLLEMSENVEICKLVQFEHKINVILMAFPIVKINGACTHSYYGL